METKVLGNAALGSAAAEKGKGVRLESDRNTDVGYLSITTHSLEIKVRFAWRVVHYISFTLISAGENVVAFGNLCVQPAVFQV